MNLKEMQRTGVAPSPEASLKLITMDGRSDLEKKSKESKKIYFGIFGLSALLHMLLLLAVGGTVLIQGIVPKAPMTGEVVAWEPENPALLEPEEPSAESGPEPPSEDPLQQALPGMENSPENFAIETPPPPSIETIFISAPSSNPVSATIGGIPSTIAQPSAPATAQKGELRKMNSLFGSKESGSATLTGYLYDLKQTPEHKPTDMAEVPGELEDGRTRENVLCREVIRNFIKRWDPQVLEKYYRSPKPLFTYQFFIPFMEAEEAPKAFDVEKKVKSRRWLIHYKGELTAPQSGRFRFVGLGDDVLLVRFNNKLVLDGSWTAIEPEANENLTNGLFSREAPDQQLRVGSWFNVSGGQSYPLEVLIGEVPGGKFASCLLIEDKSGKYQKRADGSGTSLPVFQTAPTRIPSYREGSTAPEVAREPFVFGVNP